MTNSFTFIYYLQDILDASRKDIPSLMKPVNEQCQNLRPDLFAVEGKQVLDAWVSDWIVLTMS